MKKTVKNLITWSPSHLITSQKSAFTLAEVLITLAIIGVVAAMTIPTLVANYQTRAWNTSATVFDRKLTEALKVMNTQGTLAGLKTTENFVEELSKHLKIIKTCTNDKLMDCFSEEVFWGAGTATPEAVDMSIIKTAKNFGQNDWGTNIVGIQLANGTNALVAYNPTNTCNQDPYSNQITGEKCLAILYDTTGFKSPNTSSKDLRSNSNVTNLGSGCFAEANGVCITMKPQTVTTPHMWNACQSGGTSADPYDLKFMSDYGISKCCDLSSCQSNGDYWAGAAELCGHVNKMASMQDLAKIANYVFNTDIISEDSKHGVGYDGNSLNLDYTKATSLGFTLSSLYTFNLYSREEYDSQNTITRNFIVGGIVWNYSWRSASGLQVVCVEN